MNIRKTVPPYSSEQILSYLQVIKFSPLPGTLKEVQPSLDNLEKLMRLHLVAFPYENLEMHYGEAHKVDVSPQGVFNRLVSSGRGYGTYCIGHNTLFKGILQSFSYKVIANAARVNTTWRSDPGPLKLSALGHMVLLVSITNQSADQTYLVDVGFGGIHGISALFRPMALAPDVVVTGFTPPEEHRIVKGRHPQSSFDRDECEPPSWFLQARQSSTDGWRSLYFFNTIEFFEEDFEYFSFVLSCMNTSPVYDVFMCVKIYETATGQLGRLSISPSGDKLVRKVGQEKKVVQTFENEQERIDAIRKYCGIMLEEDAISHIRGRKVEIKG